MLELIGEKSIRKNEGMRVEAAFHALRMATFRATFLHFFEDVLYLLTILLSNAEYFSQFPLFISNALQMLPFTPSPLAEFRLLSSTPSFYHIVGILSVHHFVSVSRYCFLSSFSIAYLLHCFIVCANSFIYQKTNDLRHKLAAIDPQAALNGNFSSVCVCVCDLQQTNSLIPN